MTKEDFRDWLFDMVSGEDFDGGTVRAKTFEDAGLLTRDDGLVLTMPNKDRFQITITKA